MEDNHEKRLTHQAKTITALEKELEHVLVLGINRHLS
jgi:hypothetical protein